MNDDYVFEMMRQAVRLSLPPGAFYDDVLNDLLDFHAHSLANKIRKEGSAMNIPGSPLSAAEVRTMFYAAEVIDPFDNIDPVEPGCPPGCTNPFCACPGTD